MLGIVGSLPPLQRASTAASNVRGFQFQSTEAVKTIFESTVRMLFSLRGSIQRIPDTIL